MQAPVQTFGTGARGFNVYDGSLDHASFFGEIAAVGGITATGTGSDAVHLAGANIKGLDDLAISAPNGERIRKPG